jgi:hypothetical protein
LPVLQALNAGDIHPGLGEELVPFQDVACQSFRIRPA